MSRQQIEAVVAEEARGAADALQLELVDVEYVKEHEDYILRVFIDKPSGVGLDDCQNMSEALGLRLDVVDPIPGSYALEVSSPGLTRPLKKPGDYERFAGSRVRLKTFAPIDGRKNWQGVLVGYADEEVLLEVDGVRMALPYKAIARAHLDPDIK